MTTLDKSAGTEDNVREEYCESQATGVEVEAAVLAVARRSGALGSGEDSDSHETLLVAPTGRHDRPTVTSI